MNVNQECADINSSYVCNGNEIHYNNGDVYKGDFTNEKVKHGYGTYTFRDKSSYTGHYEKDNFAKYGKFTFTNNSEVVNIICAFQNGIPNFASILYQNGSTYLGNVNEDFLPHGFGEYKDKGGDIFEGEFVNGKKKFGVQKGKLEDKMKYEMYFTAKSNNDDDLYLQIKTENEDILYEGQCSESLLKHGYGKYKTSDVDYEGEFNHNIMEGFGCIKYKQHKSEYSGEFKAGLKEGIGKYTWGNGDVYWGNFINDSIVDACGRLEFQNKNIIYTGEFNHSQISGFGQLKFKEQNKVLDLMIKENNPVKIYK